MSAFENMPNMFAPEFEVPKSDRIYELRSYESPTEEYYKRKVAMFNEGGEITLFDRLGFNAVFYAEVPDNQPLQSSVCGCSLLQYPLAPVEGHHFR